MLFHEAFSVSGSDRGHTAAAAAAAVAKAAGAERLVLIHVDPELADESALLEHARPVFPSTELAEDGMVIEMG